MTREFADTEPPGWLNRNGWKIGLTLAALIGGFWWQRAGRDRRIAVGSVSERWLAEQQFDSGQHPPE